MTENGSVVLKRRDPLGDAILPQNADELAKFMDQPLSAIAESITGALAAGPQHWTVMTGRIVQAMLKGKLLQQVSREIKALRDSGKIPDDFADRKYGFQSWVELLQIIDEESPDQDRLEALKAMFYSVNKVNATDTEQIANYLLFQTAKKLTSGELLVLKTIYRDFRSGNFSRGNSIPLYTWAYRIAGNSGHQLTALVIRDQSALVDQGLVSRLLNNPPNEVVVEADTARLTDLGVRFCENIQTYKIDVNPPFE